MSKIKAFLYRLRSVAPKIFALFSLVLVIGSILVIPSFAAVDDISVYQSIAPITFNNFSGTVQAVAFPGAHSQELYIQNDGVVSYSRTYLNNSDYFQSEVTRIFYKSVNGVSVPYFQIYIASNYSSLYVNSVSYSGSSSTPSPYTLNNVFEFICYPVQNSFNPGQTYVYYFDILLGTDLLVEQARQEGYESGYAAGRVDGYQYGYNLGLAAGSNEVTKAREEGYNEGFADGREASDSQNLGQNLLGDTLNAPFEALNGFIIYESASGFQVTLGLIVGAAICMTLFIAFLKMFAGG